MSAVIPASADGRNPVCPESARVSAAATAATVSTTVTRAPAPIAPYGENPADRGEGGHDDQDPDPERSLVVGAEPRDREILQPRRHSVDDGRPDRHHGRLAGAEDPGRHAADREAGECRQYATDGAPPPRSARGLQASLLLHFSTIARGAPDTSRTPHSLVAGNA